MERHTRKTSPRRWIACCAFVLACCVGATSAAPHAGRERPPDTAPSALDPGDYTWFPDAAPGGPLLILVSIPQQRAYVYRNGVRIAVTTVSTGTAGHDTPTGVFKVLQRKREHRSNLYDDAEMPFMHRLTWDGIALHAGRVLAAPASHGCVRLPYRFAERLFGITARGMTVVIADDAASPPEVVRPGLLAPILPDGSLHAPGVPSFWQDDLAAGPVTVVASTSQRTVSVFRNSRLVGRAPLGLRDPHVAGLRVFLLVERPSDDETTWRWLTVWPDSFNPVDRLQDRLVVDPAFARRVFGLLRPGDTVVVTDDAAEAPGELEWWRSQSNPATNHAANKDSTGTSADRRTRPSWGAN